MCGLAGFFHLDGRTTDRDDLLNMTQALHHRGPDDGGIWTDAGRRVGLGHRRLAIQDLSVHGAQPMHSPCGRYVLAYNGEIYNSPVLRTALTETGAVFKGHSDTEVLLAAIAQWGLMAAVKKLNGMFAFALMDLETHTLSLARDCLGEKPLYYTHRPGEILLFGSELKALWRHPQWQGAIDQQALGLYFRHGYIPAPHTIFKGVHKLLPGHVLSIPQNDGGSATPVVPVPYWSFLDATRLNTMMPPHTAQPGTTDTPEDLEAQLDALLTKTIEDRLIADVPVGAFLSGGIDSSLVAALMQKVTGGSAHTFSIGFKNERYNEAGYAKDVATHLGTRHTELYVGEKEGLDVVPDLATLYDEPFADSSQIPTYLVSQMAKKEVTVVLSGDGGDELFGGYSRYALTLKLWRQVSYLPGGVKPLVAKLLAMMPARCLAPLMGLLTQQSLNPATLRHKIDRLGQLLTIETFPLFYRAMISQMDPQAIVPGFTEPAPWFGALPTDPLAHMQAFDTLMYLPDDILAKVDRAAMAHGLEVRVPLIDPDVVAFAWALPEKMKYNQGDGKLILRKILAKYVPPSLFERPKMGFGIPLTEWIDGPLASWAEDLLSPESLAKSGLLDVAAVRLLYAQHKAGSKNPSFLWSLLVWQQWYAAHKGTAF